MIYTERLDKAIRIASWAHDQQKQYRKGTDIPFIIHPFSVMLIASEATADEDTLIACLLHDVLEDVDGKIYSSENVLEDFGDNVLKIVKDVTKDDNAGNWHQISEAYVGHIRHKACDEAVIVSASDKIQNLMSQIIDHRTHGDIIWQRFSTKNPDDQVWFYSLVLDAITERKAPQMLINQLSQQIAILKNRLVTG